MNTYCTLSDINYLDRGLALYQSLLDESKDSFELHYLCLDEQSYKKLIQLSLPQIVIHHVDELETRQDLQEAKNDRDRKQYIFTLASYFSDFLLNTIQCEHVLYIDADIYFYEDPALIGEACLGKHCGIMLHRHNFIGHRDGGFNVGVVWFNNSSKGREVLDWWKNAVLKREPKELSIMGDQKYLEAFIPMFGEDVIKVLDEDIGHGAPWNFRLYVYDHYIEDNIIGWGDKKQKLVFNHFSQFKYSTEPRPEISPDNDVYGHLTLRGSVFLIPEVQKMYMGYYNKLVEVSKKWL